MKHELKALIVRPRFYNEPAEKMIHRLDKLAGKIGHHRTDWSMSRNRSWSGFHNTTKRRGNAR